MGTEARARPAPPDFGLPGRTFFLGTHQVVWLERLKVPLFISARRLRGRKHLPRARTLWALDSGGFKELELHGQWLLTARDYVALVRRCRTDVGRLQWAAIQDWMCEPHILGRTGLTVREHQLRTIHSYEALQDLAPEVPWLPVLQGWAQADYLRHLDLYASRGHDLAQLPLVGIGSVCRRQRTQEAADIVRSLAAEGLRLHAFGFKKQGLAKVGQLLASSDSLAWSLDARLSPPLPGCPHFSCSSCPRFALRWRHRLLQCLGPEWAYPPRP